MSVIAKIKIKIKLELGGEPYRHYLDMISSVL